MRCCVRRAREVRRAVNVDAPRGPGDPGPRGASLPSATAAARGLLLPGLLRLSGLDLLPRLAGLRLLPLPVGLLPARLTALLRVSGVLRLLALLRRVGARIGLLAGVGLLGLAGHRRGHLRRLSRAVARPQTLLLLGAGEVLRDHGREVEVRLTGLGPHHVQVHLGARRQMLVERHDDHPAAAGLEVGHDVLDLDHLSGLPDSGDHGDAPRDQIRVAVRGQPVEGGAGAARTVHGGRGDDDELVGEVEDAAHGAVEQTRARVGEDDRVLLAQDVDDAAVVVVVERRRDRRVHVVGEDLQPRRRL